MSIKILNITRGEFIDASITYDSEYEPDVKIYANGVFSMHRKRVYKMKKPKPKHWLDTDKYKVIQDV